MDELLKQLRFNTYRLEVLKEVPASPTRDASIRSAVADIEQALEGIKAKAIN